VRGRDGTNRGRDGKGGEEVWGDVDGRVKKREEFNRRFE
jgi:hypothetical protein